MILFRLLLAMVKAMLLMGTPMIFIVLLMCNCCDSISQVVGYGEGNASDWDFNDIYRSVDVLWFFSACCRRGWRQFLLWIKTRQIIRYRTTAALRRSQMKQYTASKWGGGYKTNGNIIVQWYGWWYWLSVTPIFTDVSTQIAQND